MKGELNRDIVIWLLITGLALAKVKLMCIDVRKCYLYPQVSEI